MSKKSTKKAQVAEVKEVKEVKAEAKAEVKAVAPVQAAGAVAKETKRAPKVKAVAKAAAPVQAAGEAEEGADDQPGKRYFKCTYNGETCGRYCGNKPKQAANKAFTNIIKKHNGEFLGKSFEFELVECTRGSNKKTGKYVGVRSKLDTPLKIMIKKNTPTPKTIEYKFMNKITKVRDQVAGSKKVKTVKPKKVKATA
jgi:hypothetical protein